MTEQTNSTSERQISTLIMGGSPLTMSSREIAELTGKRHDNVRADIEKMAKDLSLNFQEKAEPSDGGRPSKVYYLPKRETLILVSGYDVVLRAKIIDRWQELEGAPTITFSIPKSLPEALRLAADLADQRDRAEANLAIVAPKAEIYDDIISTDGLFTVTTVAKILGIGPHKLGRTLRTVGWTYYRPGAKHVLAYQGKIDSGYLEHKLTPYRAPDGEEKTSTTVLFTPRGVIALARKLKAPVPDLETLKAYASKMDAASVHASSANGMH